MDTEQQTEPRIFVVATPIGNLEDISQRAIRILSEVDVIACEDTRHTRRLLTHFGITGKRVISCHDHNERNSAAGIVRLLLQGKTVALCSDAGIPVVNDPGYRVIAAAREADISVTVIPGPSAVLTALVLSGLPPHEFVFLGFPPRKSGQRRNWLTRARRHGATLVIMEAPHRLPAFLRDALEVLGDIRGAVLIEMTKKFETTEIGSLSELVERFEEPPRGELMVVLDGGAVAPEAHDDSVIAKGGTRARKGARVR